MCDVTIHVRDNGPFRVEGPVTVYDAEGNAFAVDESKPFVSLCRCGHSTRKPFCDGAHRECGFQANERGSSE